MPGWSPTKARLKALSSPPWALGAGPKLGLLSEEAGFKFHKWYWVLIEKGSRYPICRSQMLIYIVKMQTLGNL